jgi:predicted site-specific integrase-resolvase
MIAPEHAARIAGVSTRTIYVWVESGAIHFTETHGRVLICPHSLSIRARAAAEEVPSTIGSSQRRET